MTTDDPVERALAQLAREDSFRQAPPHLESALLEAFDRQQGPGSRQRSAAAAWAYGVGIGVVAVAAGVFVTISFRTPESALVGPAAPSRVSPPVVAGIAPATAATQPPSPRMRAQAAVQVDVSPPDSLSTISNEIVHSVHVSVPRSFLPLLGVPIIDPDAEGMVNLEILVAEDGLGTTVGVVR